MIPPAIRRKYSTLIDHVEVVARLVKGSVSHFCEQRGYAYVGRTKNVESVAEKLETGRFSSWSTIDDMFGCVIVIPTLLHEPDVIEFLKSTFTCVEIRQRGSTKKPPDQFRFEATRFYGHVDLPVELTEQQNTRKITFEVQIRTAFEHAWSAATHELIYKTSDIQWKAHRLAAQLKSAVEQLDTLVAGFQQATGQIIEHQWPEFQAKQLILDGFRGMFSDGLLPESLLPKDWSRFAENAYSLLGSSKSFKQGEMMETIAKSIVCLRDHAKEEGDRVPLSVSLLQWSLAVWSEHHFVVPPLKRYHALVTRELSDLYPGVRAITPIIDLDS